MAQLVEKIYFKDTSGNSSIINTGFGITISSPNNVNLIVSGAINFNKNIDCSSNAIENVVNMNNVNNSELVLSTVSTQNLNFKTAGSICLSIPSTGITSLSVVSNCSALPTLNTEFINFNTFTNIKSFTPVIQLSTNPTGSDINYSTQRGRYLQFGNLVYFTCYVKFWIIGFDNTANVRCTLPVNRPNGGYISPLIVGFYDNLNTSSNMAVLTAQIDSNATSYFTFYKKTTGSSTGNVPLEAVNINNIPPEPEFFFVVSGSYYLF